MDRVDPSSTAGRGGVAPTEGDPGSCGCHECARRVDGIRAQAQFPSAAGGVGFRARPLSDVGRLGVLATPESSVDMVRVMAQPDPRYAAQAADDVAARVIARRYGPEIGLFAKGGGSAALSTRRTSTEDAEKNAQAYRELRTLVEYYIQHQFRNGLGPQHIPFDLMVNLQDGTMTYGGQFLTAKTLYDFIGNANLVDDHGQPIQAEEVEACLEKMWRIAQINGAVGQRISVYDEVRGSRIGEEALPQKAEVVKSLPHMGLSSFASPTKKVHQTEGWRSIGKAPDVDRSSLEELFERSKKAIPAANRTVYKREVVGDVVRGEAFRKSLISKINGQCTTLRNDPAAAASGPARDAILERIKNYQDLKRRLERDHDSFAYHWANTYERLPLPAPIAAAGPLTPFDERLQKANRAEADLIEFLRKKAGVEDSQHDAWLTTTEGQGAAVYARETAGLMFDKRDEYAQWCHLHHVHPHKPSITSFMHEALQPGRAPAAARGQLSDEGWSSLEIPFDAADQVEIERIIGEAEVVADSVKNACMLKILPGGEYTDDTVDVQIDRILKDQDANFAILRS